ncbi:MAG: hypothetical protein ACW98F_20430, partial [Candidatus Hodarchaeales archaeon]
MGNIKPDDNFKPSEYWEKRIATTEDFKSVGCIGFDTAYNKWLYKAKLDTLTQVFQSHKIFPKSILDIGSGTGI